MKLHFTTVLLIAVLLVLIVSCGKETREPLTTATQNQIALLPQDATMLGYVNFQQIYQSSLANLFTDSMNINPLQSKEYQEFIDSTEFDLREDIHELFFAAAVDTNEENGAGLVVAIGNYDSEKIMNYIKLKDEEKELINEKYLNYNLYRFEDEKAFCFADEKTFVGGKHHLVKSWLDNFAAKSELTVDPELLDRIENLKYKTSAWFTMESAPFLKELDAEEISEKFDGIKDLKKFNISFNVTDRLNFYGQCECSDIEKAGLFKDAIKGAIATAKLSVSDDRRAVDILNKINIHAHKNSVEIDFQMTEAEIMKLMARKHGIQHEII